MLGLRIMRSRLWSLQWRPPLSLTWQSSLACMPSTPRWSARPYSIEAAVKCTSTIPITKAHISPTMMSPLEIYDARVRNQLVRGDTAQRAAVQQLEELWLELQSYTPPPTTDNDTGGVEPTNGLWRRWFGHRKPARPANQAQALRSLYIHGDVGTGKSMVMDLFYDALPLKQKQRVHFHAFMLDIHARVHELTVKHPKLQDPLGEIAKDLRRSAYVLCFDEFQVTDIADAMILRRLLTALFDNGMVLVATSNRHPKELYKNGIQRASFLPCIDLLLSKCDILNLDGGTDYRQIEREPASHQVYFYPLSAQTRQHMDELTLCLTQGAPMTPMAIRFLGRDLVVPRQANGVARMSFEDTCSAPLSAADYLQLVRHFHTIILTDIPRMTMKHRAEARRFITFIDAMYEAKVTLVASAETDLRHLFNANEDVVVDESLLMMMDDLKLTDISSPLFTGQEEAFAFQRALSRLVQMQSKDWVNKALR